MKTKHIVLLSAILLGASAVCWHSDSAKSACRNWWRQILAKASVADIQSDIEANREQPADQKAKLLAKARSLEIYRRLAPKKAQPGKPDSNPAPLQIGKAVMTSPQFLIAAGTLAVLAAGLLTWRRHRSPKPNAQ